MHGPGGVPVAGFGIKGHCPGLGAPISRRRQSSSKTLASLTETLVAPFWGLNHTAFPLPHLNLTLLFKYWAKISPPNIMFFSNSHILIIINNLHKIVNKNHFHVGNVIILKTELQIRKRYSTNHIIAVLIACVQTKVFVIPYAVLTSVKSCLSALPVFGRRVVPLVRGRFLSPDLQKGGCQMSTSEVFGPCLVIIGIYSLFLQICKKKQPPQAPNLGGCFCNKLRGLTAYRQRPFYFQYNRSI